MLKQLYHLMDQGEWVQVKREAESLLQMTSPDDTTAGRIYRALGRANFGLSQYDAARRCFEVGLACASRAGDWDFVGYNQHNLAVCEMVLGNRKAAQTGFESFLFRLNRYQEARRLEGMTHYNLGLLYRQQRDYSLALAAYSQALHCFQRQGEHRNAGDTHQNIAWLLLLEQRSEEAREHIILAAAYSDKLPEDYHTEQLVLFGFFHLVLGDYAASMGYLNPVLENSVKVFPSHKAAATWVLAQLQAEQGQTELARRTLQEALTLAMATRETHLVSLCEETEAKLHVLGGSGKGGAT